MTKRDDLIAGLEGTAERLTALRGYL